MWTCVVGAMKRKKAMTQLEDAIENGHLDRVKCLYNKGADLETGSPLVLCIQHNRLSIAKFLVEVGANTTLPQGRPERPPLYYAVSKGNLEMVKLLLDNGANFTMYECLEHAIKTNKLEIVRELIKRGVDVHRSDGRSERPIMSAIRKGSYNILKLLIENGVDADGVDRRGDTPLTKSIRLMNPIPMIEYLIDVTKINMNTIPNDGSESPIMCAAGTRSCDVLELLLKKGANVNVVDRKGDTPLIRSVRLTNVPMTACLIRHKADLNAKNANNETPLSVALAKSDFRTFKLLVESGADPKLASVAIEAMAKKNKDFAAYMARIEETKKIEDPRPEESAGSGHEAAFE